MEAVKIITLPPSETLRLRRHSLHLPRVDGTTQKSNVARRARVTYEGALRRKLRLDLLSWGDLKRKAQALIEADNEYLINVSLLQ